MKQTMKKYFENLLQALLGRNPYQPELDELREHYEQAAERVQALTDIYYKTLEEFEAGKQRVLEYQRLTENLRQRIADYQEQVEEYRKETNRLRRSQHLSKKKEGKR